MWEYEHNELYHHGVRGMKWGQRRFQNPDGTLTNAGKKNKKKLEAKENTPEAIKKKISGMTDTDIQQKISRLQNEKLLMTLMTELDPNQTAGKESAKAARVAEGKKKALEILGDSGKKLFGKIAEATGTAISKKMFDQFTVDENAKNKARAAELDRNLTKKKEAWAVKDAKNAANKAKREAEKSAKDQAKTDTKQRAADLKKRAADLARAQRRGSGDRNGRNYRLAKRG